MLFRIVSVLLSSSVHYTNPNGCKSLFRTHARGLVFVPRVHTYPLPFWWQVLKACFLVRYSRDAFEIMAAEGAVAAIMAGGTRYRAKMAQYGAKAKTKTCQRSRDTRPERQGTGK